MNPASMSVPHQFQQALDTYQPAPDSYDELMANGQLRSGWASLLEHPLAAPFKDLQSRADSGAAGRPWPLDALPYLADAEEWRLIERGLLQRARLLNAIVADFYGPQLLLRKKGLPPALVFANPGYLAPCCNYEARGGIHLHLLAFDLGRSPDGQWRVLGSRTETPAGFGFALQNRIDTAHLLPDLLEKLGIARLAAFYRTFGDQLAQRGRDVGEGLTVILSGGPKRAGYWEHTYLGQYLGFSVVEGADLTVRRGNLYLRSLEGLQPVRAVARQVESALCDPLELIPTSMQGTPGLLAAAARGRVTVTNCIGSGVVENEALPSFLPGLCEAILNEPLILPSLASWWCGQPTEARHVADNLDGLVLRDAFERLPWLDSRFAANLLPNSSGDDRDALKRKIRRQPYSIVGKEPLRLSSMPYWGSEGRLEPAPMILRLFVAATSEGYRLLPGGLARVATPRGDLSKDVWVVGDHGPPLLASRTGQGAARRRDQGLPSRTGDDLFWLGRYLERSESAVRTYRELFHYIAAGGDEYPVELEILTGVLVGLGYLSAHRARRAVAEGRRAVERELWQMLFDPESEDGLAKLLGRMHGAAEQVRQRLSQDARRILESLANPEHLRWRVHGIGDATSLLDDLLVRLAAASSQLSENMTRNQGWRMLDLGKRIERLRLSARIVRELCAADPGRTAGRLHLLLLIQDSRLTYQARYQTAPQLPGALDLLLLDAANPRSAMYQAERIFRHLQQLPLEDRSRGLSPTQRVAFAARNDLALADPDQLATVISKRGVRSRLQRLLQRTEQAAAQLSALIAKTYFEHASGQIRRER